jgi:non-specific serine/threonine protein kinase/serine/threonine-protein kinase
MTPEKWREVKEIFNEAVELSADEREKFLAGRIDGDAEMRREVEKLLASDEHAETLFDAVQLVAPKDFSIEDKIGNYQIIKKIGEGGMGAVFLAERAHVQQRVALKIIRRGADSEVILKRFRREQEILAALEHPNIARLLDVGASLEGIPFLAMEYVEGEDLTTYSRRKNLSVGKRLILFRKVCEAVSYAHSRLIVHRDLKPLNIIVNEKGEPKLLDFGISKLISDSDSKEDKGTVTSLGMLTPNYASPEQFRGETVSTLTDVYSLGVILFELLTDALPYEITNKRLDEVARAVIETNPQKPSEAVGGSTESNKQKTDDRRATNSKSKSQSLKSLRGDLDNIILRSLRKEPERRYSSVEQFSEDLRRHLDGQPVTARPDTFSYRAEKFIRRNRAAVLAGLVILLTLIGGIAATSWQAVRAERQRILAEKRFVEVRQIANNVIFKYYDEIQNLEGATKARNLIISDAATYLENLYTTESSDSQLKNEIGRAFVRLAEIQGGNAEANVGDSQASLQSFRRAVSLLEEAAAAMPSDAFTLDLINALNRYGMQLVRDKDYKGAQTQFNRAVELIGGITDENRLSAKRTDGSSPILELGVSLLSLCQAVPSGTEEGESVYYCERSRNVFLDELSKYPPTAENRSARFDVYQGLIAAEQQLGIAYLILADGTNVEFEPEKKTSLYKQAQPYLRRAIDYAKELVAANPNDERVRNQILFSTLYETTAMRGAGDASGALQIQLELLEEAKAFAAKDEQNVEIRYDVFRVLDQIAQTYHALKNYNKSLETYEQAEKVLDAVIALDDGNAEAQTDKFNMILKAGETEIETGEYTLAEKTFQRALNFAKSASQLKDTPYEFYAEGSYQENSALLKRAQAERNNRLSKQERLKLLEQAKDDYQSALAMWKEKTVELEEFGITDEKIGDTENKISQCEKLAEQISNS